MMLETFKRCLATFLIWFSMSLGAGIAILICLEIFLFYM